MKLSKVILTVALLISCVGLASAQDGTATRSQVVLPKQGDIALGIDMQPILKYAGNIFNGSTSNSLSEFGGEAAIDLATSTPTVSILAKYMLTDNIALRANVGVLSDVTTTTDYVQDDLLAFDNPLSEAKVVDSKQTSTSGAVISLGAEYRRGYNRIQGFAGANIIYGYARSTTNYSYGNAITELNQTPERKYSYSTVSYLDKAYKLSEYSVSPTTTLGLGVNVGVEVFLASHFSIGGELQLYATQTWEAQQYTLYEGYNSLTEAVEEYTNLDSPGGYTSFKLATGNLGASLFMMFYF